MTARAEVCRVPGCAAPLHEGRNLCTHHLYCWQEHQTSNEWGVTDPEVYYAGWCRAMADHEGLILPMTQYGHEGVTRG